MSSEGKWSMRERSEAKGCLGPGCSLDTALPPLGTREIAFTLQCLMAAPCWGPASLLPKTHLYL